MIKIGKVSVDSGTLLIGDPSYWLSDSQYDKEVLQNFSAMHRAIPHDLGHPGKGILVGTGYGDGLYDVFAEIENERIKRISITFF